MCSEFTLQGFVDNSHLQKYDYNMFAYLSVLLP